MTSAGRHLPLPVQGWRSDSAWLAAAALLAVLLGVAVVSDLKLALALVVMLVAVLLPLVVIGLRLDTMTAVLLLILYVAPEIRISARLPIVMGDEALLYATGLLMLVYALTRAADEPGFKSMPAAAWALALFFPLTLLTIAYGAARFNINPVLGDYFEFVKFGKYVLAIYITSQLRADRKTLSLVAWAVVIGGLVASLAAMAQVLDLPGARAFFRGVYFAANPEKTSIYLENRALGTIGNANELALFIGASLVIASVLLRQTAEPRRRMLLWVCIGFSVFAILASGSRMGIACAGIAIVLTFARAGSAARNALFAAVIIGLIVAVFWLGGTLESVLPKPVADALYPILHRLERFSPERLANIDLRINLWRIALAQSRSSILLGYGPAKGADFLATSGTIDSEIVMVTLRYGVIGLVTWLSIWYVFLRTGRRAVKVVPPEQQPLARAVWALIFVNFLATSLNYTFFALRRMTLVCALVGISAAMIRTHSSRSDRARAT